MRKRKKKKLNAGALARRMARAVFGTPPGERVLPPKKKKQPKHKKLEWERDVEE